jgi:hypothetical protein
MALLIGYKVACQFESHPLRQRVCDVEHSPQNCTEAPRVRRLVVSKSTRDISTLEIPTPFAWILSISDFGGGLWRSEH